MKAENWRDAERVALEAYALRVEQLGREAPESIQSLNNLGANALRLGNYETAKQRLTDALALADAMGSDGSRLRGHARSYLGLALAKLGEHGPSLEMCRQAKEELTRTIGVDHPVFVKLSLVWADAALARGEWDDAISGASAAAARTAVVLGNDHPDTVVARRKADEIVASAQEQRKR
jgi:tetratricopeptide (TPR) repeat protein